MVACLERTDRFIEFHQIVDFLTSNPIHYALIIDLAEPFNDVYVTSVHTKKETGSGSRPRCEDTTLRDANVHTSMEHHDDLTDFIPPIPYDSPLSGGHTPGSDEGDFDDDFDDIDDMVDKTIENIKGDTVNVVVKVSATSASVTTAGVSISTAEPKTPPITTKAFEVEDLTIAQTLVKMRSEKAK
uniref:Uncharacterized protein n=1 Tax=Tanacetum cinerariifolium TaxID=118510 RepID=A0A6L2KBK6_TANCI|nr:hypothetical protein [Tanacetum cinerariifolium]